MRLIIQIKDDTTTEDEAYEHSVDLGVDKAKIMAAIAVFYPNATSILMLVEEED